MGIELELVVLLVIRTLGTIVFGRFEFEASLRGKIAKWLIVDGGTIGLYYLVGHWALGFRVGLFIAATTVHFIACRREGFDPIYATPRKKYYDFKGWSWPA